MSGHEGAKSRRKLYTARKNKIVHIFVDNQWFSVEKLYSFFTGVQFCQATKALSREENFTLSGKIKLYTFLLIINGLVLKNFTVSLQVYNFVRPRALSREENCIVSGKIKLYTFLLIINGLVGILSESRIKGISQITRKLYTLRKNKIVHVFVDNQWLSVR